MSKNRKGWKLMKKAMFFLVTLFFWIGMASVTLGYAEEIEVYRGEEEETEIYLEGSEDVYSVYGELEYTKDFIQLEETEQSNSLNYQAMKIENKNMRILLSNKGSSGYGLQLRLRVEGKRIGAGTVSLAGLQMTNEAGEWLTNVYVPDITVKVLPNPLYVYLSGTEGNNDWYLSPVTVSISDKDAAELWYDFGGGKLVYTGPFEVGNGTSTIMVTSDDGYGYKKEEVRRISVDTIKPDISVSLMEREWQKENIQITVDCKDSISGISHAQWGFSTTKENVGSWNSLTEEEVLSMEQDGIWYLHLRAVDVAGNEDTAVYGPYRKDSVKPEIRFTNIYQGQLLEESFIPTMEITDSCSGIKNITYQLDGQVWNPSEITGKGKHVLTVTAEDLAGNIHSETVEFFIYDNIKLVAEAHDSHYTGTASFSALVTYQGKPLPDAEVEFLVNGESLGTRTSNKDGMVWMEHPLYLAPQDAVLSVRVSQDDERYLLAAEATTGFTVYQERAWMLYGGDYHVWNGESLQIYLELGELPDFCWGDITLAEVRAELFKIENDGNRTYVEEAILHPNEWGVIEHDFYPETGLYEIKMSCTENSYYIAPDIVLHPAVFQIEADLNWQGGSLLLDLPQLGIYMKLAITFLPPSMDAQIEVRIPGTGITLTKNTITDYDITTDGLVLYGKAINPVDGYTYSYEVHTGYALGFLLDELETSIWKGEDKTQEPAYHFEWSAKEMWEE